MPSDEKEKGNLQSQYATKCSVWPRLLFDIKLQMVFSQIQRMQHQPKLQKWVIVRMITIMMRTSDPQVYL